MSEVLRAPWARAHRLWFDCRLNQNYYRDLCATLTIRDFWVRTASVAVALTGGTITAMSADIKWAAPVGAIASALLTTWTMVSTDSERARVASSLLAQYIDLEGEARELYFLADEASSDRLAAALARYDKLCAVEAEKAPIVDGNRLKKADALTRSQFKETTLGRT